MNGNKPRKTVLDKNVNGMIRNAVLLAEGYPVMKPVTPKFEPLYKRDLLGHHRVPVYRPKQAKPGTTIQFRNSTYVVRADGSLKRIT